ncbi:MAG: hypothetical protein PUF12_12665 [Thermoflexaceae bacterium]|nr:hypothetical protein [Thermoflexaceae bacterium]
MIIKRLSWHTARTLPDVFYLFLLNGVVPAEGVKVGVGFYEHEIVKVAGSVQKAGGFFSGTDAGFDGRSSVCVIFDDGFFNGFTEEF